MNPRYPLVAERAHHRCEYCGAPEATFNFPFEVEHIEPPNQGGVEDPSNLALACRSCNVYKSTWLDGVDTQTEASVCLFNPRRDSWSEHFRADVVTGGLTGLTPVGRATIWRLHMNTGVQIEARCHWIRLKLFPPV